MKITLTRLLEFLRNIVSITIASQLFHLQYNLWVRSSGRIVFADSPYCTMPLLAIMINLKLILDPRPKGECFKGNMGSNCFEKD
jgi:hypothetical protein